MKKYNKEKVYTKESRCFFFALTLVCVMVTAYMYFLSASVLHVVMRKEIDTELSQLNSKVGDLEAVYIEMQHAVSNELATREGFVPIDDKIFINTAEKALVLSRN
jgi:hypothetical protein